MCRIVIIGANQAAEIIAAARLSQQHVVKVYDDDATLWGQTIADVPVVGPIMQACHDRHQAVLAIEDPRQRRAVVAQLRLPWISVFHPKAIVDRYAKVEEGTVILDGAVIQPGARIGAHVFIGPKSSVTHDCLIDDFTHISNGVQLAGFVKVGQGARLGEGVVVTPNIRLGMWSYVAPGSVVIRDIADYAQATGIPARPLIVPLLTEQGAEYRETRAG